jgi:hypothetical protein
MMQTMNSDSIHPPSLGIRVLLLALSTASGIGVVLSHVGVRVGFLYLIPLALTFLLLRIFTARERAQAKKKAPDRSARPGA